MQKICRKTFERLALSLALAGLGACGETGHGDDDGHDHGEENEVISRVELTFTPTGGGAPLVFAFDDPDGDGGESGTSDTIQLAAGAQYDLAVRFINSYADPQEDITDEIAAEAEDHLVFVTSSSASLFTHAYADVESDYGENAVGDDLPVGLAYTITAGTAGTGELRIILRHLPPLNDQPQKTAELPPDLAAGRDLPGSVDADITFALVVS